MRIAFDLDDTLVPTSRFACGNKSVPFPFSIFFKEKLRSGSVGLLKKISKDHELWIYTTSYRKPFYIKTWFRILGIKLDFVINQSIHEKTVKSNSCFSNYSKAPKLFGIDLLVDDLPGVGIECEKQGCDYIIILPSDYHWVKKIQNKIKNIDGRLPLRPSSK